MKIYFAYRTGYKTNLRYLKEFEANSILDWFVENWDTLSSDVYADLLGTNVYGFPISLEEREVEQQKQSFFSKLFNKKEANTNIQNKPTSFEDLLNLLQEGVYLNEIESDDNCIRVETDDDEIGLAWYIFTEEYKIKNEDKVAIWFNDVLPTSFGTTGVTLGENTNVLGAKGAGEGYTYFISVPIYDSLNIEDMTVVKIEGVRLDNLVDFLKNNDLEEVDDVLYAVDELNYIKYMAQQLNSNDLKTVLEAFARYPLTELQGTAYEECQLSEIKKMELNTIPEKSTVIVNEHSAEVSVNSINIYYSYYILIDDLWIEQNEALAKSILYFGSNWDI